MGSLWEQESRKIRFESLNRDIKTDVLIIGGGMAGVLCAYMLHQSGVPYVLAEAETIGSGITKNTTAKITCQHGLIYDQLIRKFGMERAEQYLKANEDVLIRYRDLCRNSDCDFEEKDSYVYSLDSRQKIEKEIRALEKLGVHAEDAAHLPLPFSVAGAVRYPKQAQFHPLKFISAVSEGLHIYEHTAVRELAGTEAITDHGKITAKKIIAATHFPFLNKHGSYFIKLYQSRSYVTALENAPDVHGVYVDEAQTGMSFRNYGSLLLLGGGDHRTGKKGGNWRELAGTAGFCTASLCRRRGKIPLGSTGLHDARRHSVYRHLFRGHGEFIRRHRIPQMGNDRLYGFGNHPVRPYPGEEKPICGRFFTIQNHTPSAAGCQRI